MSAPPLRIVLATAHASLPVDATRPPNVVSVADDMAITLDDGTVDSIDAGTLPLSLSPTALPALLAECRRVLRPSGTLTCDAAAEVTVERFAALIGLQRDASSEASTRGPAFVKPDRRVTGDPLVSIVIPAHRPRFFAAALASAVGQTWGPIEIVVCDDSDGEDIAPIARQAARQRSLRYVRNDARAGTRANMVRGLREARGEFVKYLNDDDLLAPDCVATLVESFRNAPDVVLASSWRRRIDERDRALSDQPATVPIADRDVVVSGVSLANAMLVTGLNIVGEPTTVMFRRSEFRDDGDDPFAFQGIAGRGLVDMTMWATLLPRGNAVWHRRALSAFRIHAGQSQRDPVKTQRASAAVRSLQQAWLALGFPTYLRATDVLVQPYPPGAGDGWRWHPVPSLVAMAQRYRRSFASDAWRYVMSYVGGDRRGGA